MLRYSRLAAKPEVFRALTGLSIQEFEALLPSFNTAWEKFLKATFIDGVARRRAFGGGRIPRLKTGRAKLLFILFYLRIYPIQEVQGFFFGLSQEQANCWIHRLMPVLSQALGREALLPERRPMRLEEVLRQYPALQEEVTQKEGTSEDSSSEDSSSEDSSSEDSSSEEGSEEDSGSVLFIDGTERRIRRPKDPGRRKTFYSGKKKGHTVKNVLFTDLDRQVLFLSETYEGKKHDKSIADEENYRFPEGTTLYQDKGFQGYAPPGAAIRQPKKKPKGRELTDAEKAENSAINAVRVKVEHAIGGVKVFRITHDIYRNYKQGFEDLVMEAACGLHNLRCRTRAAMTAS